MRKSYEMDMTRGPLLRSILIFTLPLLLSGVLQLLFNATDIVVVGQFAGANAMASVGSTANWIRSPTIPHSAKHVCANGMRVSYSNRCFWRSSGVV